MKLKLTLSTTILLAATSVFAGPPPLPNTNSTQHHLPTTPHSATANYNHGNNVQHNDQPEAPKKIDPKLQAKLDAKVDDVSEAEYQKIVSEYKEYLRHVPSEVRQEIRAYRQEIVQINKAKTALYKKLSQEAQGFLAKERDIKKKLPIKDKAAFSKELRASDAE